MTASMPVGRALDRIVPVAQGIDGISIDRCRRGLTALTDASGAGGEVVETPTKCWLRRWGGLLHRCTTPAGVAPGIERGDRTWTARGALPWQDGATPTPRARRWKTHMGTSTTPPGLAGARRGSPGLAGRPNPPCRQAPFPAPPPSHLQHQLPRRLAPFQQPVRFGRLFQREDAVDTYRELSPCDPIEQLSRTPEEFVPRRRVVHHDGAGQEEGAAAEAEHVE